MRRYLLAAIWPAGLAAIASATLVAAQRASSSPGQAAVTPLDPGPDNWAKDLIRLGAISGAGGVLSYQVMTLIGPAVVKHGPAIDERIYRWTSEHQVKRWAAVMERFNKIGNTWTAWGAAAAAGACLAVTWPQRKWLPPAALGAAIVVDHYATLALRRKFGRPGPPPSPLGTYPAGGCDRAVLFYGLIAYLLWREFDGTPRGKAWGIGAVATLSFNVAYCREYLSKHWFTDIASGLVYGLVLLGPFVAAVRLIDGPAGSGPARASG
jgi:membrane-associated phospholipid phosphatase